MATEDQSSGFDDLEPVESPDYEEEEVEWVDLEDGESIVGELREVRENCGDNNSRVYKIADEIGEPLKLLWGKASIDRQVDQADLGPGDVIGIRNTGDSFETDNGYEGTVYEVRHQGGH
jgi:hypothetical protein